MATSGGFSIRQLRAPVGGHTQSKASGPSKERAGVSTREHRRRHPATVTQTTSIDDKHATVRRFDTVRGSTYNISLCLVIDLCLLLSKQ